MVGPMMLLKMLHCKRLRSRKQASRPSSDDEEDTCGEGTSQDDFHVKKEDSEFIQLCRVCLKDGNIPIYGNEVNEDLSESLSAIGGIQMRDDDHFPKSLCPSCFALLQGAMLFRKTAQESDELLRRPIDMQLHPDNDHDAGDIYGDDTSSEDEVLQLKTSKKESESINPNDVQPKDEFSLKPKLFCKRCDIPFNTFKEYSEHRLSPEHENSRRTCPICKNSYTVLYYKKHLALHKMDTQFMCDICGKKFAVQGQFTRHRLTHFYSLPFACPQCPYKGRFRESLKMHMRTHTGEKPYQCAQCASRFINKSNLNKHMLTHKGEHDFKCDICGRGFYTKRNLDLHFKVDHTGIKDHVCNMCGKAFGYRKQMMKHQLKVHKREKLRSGRLPLYLQVETMKQQGKKVSAET